MPTPAQDTHLSLRVPCPTEFLPTTTPEILEIPKAKVAEEFLNPATAKFDNVFEGERAENLVAFIQSLTAKRP